MCFQVQKAATQPGHGWFPEDYPRHPQLSHGLFAVPTLRVAKLEEETLVAAEAGTQLRLFFRLSKGGIPLFGFNEKRLAFGPRSDFLSVEITDGVSKGDSDRF
jgi:hypothetical protein